MLNKYIYLRSLTSNLHVCPAGELCLLSTSLKAGVGVMAPLAALEAAPVPNAVAVVSLEEAAQSGGQVNLPEGAIRLAVSIKVTYRTDLGSTCWV